MRLPRIVRKVLTRGARKKRREAAAELDKLRPLNEYSDDNYIVAYPKSGTTWLSFLLANANLLINKIPAQATWWNIREFVFDVGENRNIPASPFALPHGRFIQTHSLYQHAMMRVLYLVRDPRDTLVSYYDMKTKMGWYRGTMDEFLAVEIPAWNQHIESWVRGHTALSYIQFYRYEDLHIDPLSILQRIYKLYGVEVEPGVLEKAIDLSSFKTMRESEAFYREMSYDIGSEFQFVRKGMAGGFAVGMSSTQIALVEDRCSRWMELFGYGEKRKVPTQPPI